jgi:hypothetical protein
MDLWVGLVCRYQDLRDCYEAVWNDNINNAATFLEVAMFNHHVTLTFTFIFITHLHIVFILFFR